MLPKKVSEILGCNGCPMQGLFPHNNFVAPKPGSGKILVIAEAPGQEESILGEPLVGGSGRIFDSLCRKAGLSRDSLTLVNCIQCRPPENNFPTDAKSRYYISKTDAEAAVTQCVHNHVKPLLESNNWTKVILLGEKALKYIAKIDGTISKWRGFIVTIDTEKL